MNNFLISSICECDNDFFKNYFILVKLLENYNLKVKVFNPIYSSVYDIRQVKDRFSKDYVQYELAFDLLSTNKKNNLLELITQNFYNYSGSYNVSLIYGRYPYNKLFSTIYGDISNTLNASQIILLSLNSLDEDTAAQKLFINYVYSIQSGIDVAGFILTEYDSNIFDIVLFLDSLKILCEKSANELINFIGYISKSDSDNKIEVEKIKFFKSKIKDNISPIFFRYKLMQLAKKSLRTIILPEGDEVRIIKAAIFCETNKIAHLILLSSKERVLQVVKDNNLKLPKSIEIINPTEICDRYVQKLYELRKHKGMDLEQARSSLQDSSIVLGTMMLQEGDVDGLVCGACHTTADTILPALKIIKLKPNELVVSSVFFMLMPKKVVLFADCAVNTNPTSEELAQIAISSSKMAQAFGIIPKVALISYSTKNSGTGKDVDFINDVILLIKQQAPDLLVDGPLQYDAAYVKSVGKQKAPKSNVAGDANVFIFPNLNTGNAVYKAVQRSGNITSIGPILQGLKKPVNDLSRGSLVDDIIYTIAITAIQCGIA